MSLRNYLAKLSNPASLNFDDEIYEDDDLENIVVENQDVYQKSQLRSRAAPLLEDIDPAYVGRKVSRKSRGLVFGENKGEDNEYNSGDKSASDNNQDEDDDEKDDDDEEDDDDKEDDDDEEDDLSEEDISKFANKFQNKFSSDVEENEENIANESEDDEDVEKDDMITQFANIDVSNDIQKGKAIKSQEEIWNKLCEMRIKLQKLLVIANKLPQTNHWHSFKSKGGDEMSELVNKDTEALKVLLTNLLQVQSELNKCNKNEDISTNEREIHSDSEIESDEAKSDHEEQGEDKIMKRKYKNEDYSEILAKKFKSEKVHRNSVIQKWDEKVRLSSGRITQKSFNAFNNSAVKQIEQVLQDRNRLIKRTQLKRSAYRILGKPEFTDDTKNSIESEVSKQDLLLKDYDSQIFDDDDFYRQLLKDIIQSKSFGLDPSIVRKQMELQTIRNKMKRKVDTKASKGRKLRYDIHPKLVSYMAPVQKTTISDEARESLLKCLFGKSMT